MGSGGASLLRVAFRWCELGNTSCLGPGVKSTYGGASAALVKSQTRPLMVFSRVFRFRNGETEQACVWGVPGELRELIQFVTRLLLL